MTQQETIQELKSNKYFAVQFSVDNNPAGFITQLSQMGYGASFVGDISTDAATAKKIIYQLIGNKDQKAISRLFSNVPYLNNDTGSAEYTKGFRNFFLSTTPTSAVDANTRAKDGGFSFDGLFAGIGSGLLTYANFSAASKAGGGTASPEEAKKAEEAAMAAKKKQTWVIVGVISFAVLIIGIIVIATMPKKAKQA